MAVQGFSAVQERLTQAYQADTLASSMAHTVIALPSYSIGGSLLEHYANRIPALEQRYLFAVLRLCNPSCEIVYLASTTTPVELVDYYLDLLPQTVDREDARRRMHLISVDDASVRPLSLKILDRPEVIDRVRGLIAGRSAVIEPWNVTAAEERLAVALGAPINGAASDLWRLATKRGGRHALSASGVRIPVGRDVNSSDDLPAAIDAIRSERRSCTAVVVKLDDSASGDGNQVVRVGPDRNLKADLAALPLWFVKALDRDGGIVEERIDGSDFRSPSVQLQVGPTGTVTVLSTHEQVLGGPDHQVFLGCRMPADPAYAADIAADAERAARALAERGVAGRLSVDFVTVRQPASSTWERYALEINLRKGGTTHPYGTMRLLTFGSYDPAQAAFLTPDGQRRCYVATDNLVNESWRELTPAQAIETVHRAGTHYDSSSRTGVVLHMLSALPIDGRMGLTAIGGSAEQAQQLYDDTVAALADVRPGEAARAGALFAAPNA